MYRTGGGVNAEIDAEFLLYAISQDKIDLDFALMFPYYMFVENLRVGTSDKKCRFPYTNLLGLFILVSIASMHPREDKEPEDKKGKKKKQKKDENARKYKADVELIPFLNLLRDDTDERFTVALQQLSVLLLGMSISPVRSDVSILY